MHVHIIALFFIQILRSFILLIIRLALTVFCIVCLICSGFQDSNGETKWFIYLTNWSFTLLTLTLILLSYLSSCHVYYEWRNRFHDDPENVGGDYGSFETLENAKLKKGSETEILVVRKDRDPFKPKPSRWYHQVTWLLYNVAFSAGILVTVFYWAFVLEGTPGFLDVSAHALNSVVILIEFFLGRVPIRLLHAIYTMFYCTVYVIFTVIYWKAGGLNAEDETYIYEDVDYDKNSAGEILAMVLPAVLIVPPLCQLFFFGLYKLRCRWFDPFNND